MSDEVAKFKMEFEYRAKLMTGSAIGQRHRVRRYMEGLEIAHDAKLVFTKDKIIEAIQHAQNVEKSCIGFFIEAFLDKLDLNGEPRK